MHTQCSSPAQPKCWVGSTEVQGSHTTQHSPQKGQLSWHTLEDTSITVISAQYWSRAEGYI